MRHTYFDFPTQVRFYDVDGDKWIGGIAYKDKIMCGCCGGLFSIEEIYEFAPENLEEPIKVYKNWVDLSSAIMQL